MTYDPIDTNEADSTADGSVTAQDLVINGLLNGADISGAAAEEALTSDGTGGFGFSAVGSAAITRNGNEIEYVGLNTSDLPAPTGNNEIGLLTQSDEYVQDVTSPPGDLEFASREKIVDTVPTDDRIQSFDISPDGSKLYQLENRDQTSFIYQFSLSTPFDLATRTLEKQIDAEEGNQSIEIELSSDGTKLYEVGFDFGRDTSRIYQSTLSTPFDIGTASFDKFINPRDNAIAGLTIAFDGSKLLESGRDNDDISQFTLSTPFDIGSASFDTSFQSDLTSNGVKCLEFSKDGSKFYAGANGFTKIEQFNLSTPFDIGSRSLDIKIDAFAFDISSIKMSSDGLKFYQMDPDSENLIQSEIVRTDEWKTI